MAQMATRFWSSTSSSCTGGDDGCGGSRVISGVAGSEARAVAVVH